VSGSQGSQARGTSSSSAVSKILKGEYYVLVILCGMSGLCEVYWKGVWKSFLQRLGGLTVSHWTYIQRVLNLIPVQICLQIFLFRLEPPLKLLLCCNSGSLGFLNDNLPFKAILDLFCPFYKFHLSHVVPDIIL
jgi:hypothetical protein